MAQVLLNNWYWLILVVIYYYWVFSILQIREERIEASFLDPNMIFMPIFLAISIGELANGEVLKLRISPVSQVHSYRVEVTCTMVTEHPTNVSPPSGNDPINVSSSSSENSANGSSSSALVQIGAGTQSVGEHQVMLNLPALHKCYRNEFKIWIKEVDNNGKVQYNRLNGSSTVMISLVKF